MAPSRCRLRTWLAAVAFATQVTRLDGTGTGVVTSISPTSISAGSAATITLSGSGGTGDKAEFLATCGAAPTLTATALGGGGGVTVTVTMATPGTYKVCYRASGDSDSVEQAGGITLTVVAATSATKVSSITPMSIYQNVATSITLTANVNTGDKAIFATDCSAATPSVAVGNGVNPSVTFTVASTGSNFRMCYRNVGGHDSIAQTGFFLSVSAAGAFSGNDPVAWFGDKMRLFSLPPGELVPLVHATDMTIYGETFQYEGPWQQWFGRMIIASPDGERWVQIRARKDILEFNRTRAPKGHFESIEVTLGHGSFDNPTVATRVLGPLIEIPLNFLGFDVVFWPMARNSNVRNSMIGGAHRECMEVAGANVHFYICSAPALEFYGWQRDLSIQNAHLDLMVVEVLQGEKLTGTLPELWGVQPMSEATQALIIKEGEEVVPPIRKVTLHEEPARLSLPKVPESPLASGKAWAGGFNYKDLDESCQKGNETVVACRNQSNFSKDDVTQITI